MCGLVPLRKTNRSFAKKTCGKLRQLDPGQGSKAALITLAGVQFPKKDTGTHIGPPMWLRLQSQGDTLIGFD
jgi:hypothetical protein